MKEKRRIRWLILAHVLLLVVLGGAVVEFAEEIQAVKEKVYYTLFPLPVTGATDDQIVLHPVEKNPDAWYAKHPLIHHAGGEIEGNSYTNSLEALENTLAEGKFFIELDLRYTSDGHLVCTHSWTDAYLEDYQPTLEEFENSRIQGKFTPLTAKRMMQIMKENKQMYLVTDIKEADLATVVAELAQMADWDPAVLDRFIIQLYTGREKPEILEVYPFRDEQFIFTTYEWGKFQLEVAQICNEENIAVITAPYGEISDKNAKILADYGFTVYEHTVNRADEACRSLRRGISGFYTDALSEEDLLCGNAEYELPLS